MARMMRHQSWVKVTNTYGADYSGSFRGRDRREAQDLVAEWSDEIYEEKRWRELRDFYYARYSREHAERMLGLLNDPTLPEPERRTPE